MDRITDSDVYQLIGEDGFRRLVAAFYARVPDDDVLGPMYPPQDLAGAEQRLRGFLIQRFGGPDDYSRVRGHPRLRMRHAPFVITSAARQRWIELMTAALEETSLPAAVRQVLEQYFHDTATAMVNRS